MPGDDRRSRRRPPATCTEPRTRRRPVGQRLRRDEREEHADTDAERRADQRGDDALVPDHPPHLPAGHADRPQHPELARPLEDREDERVDDAEQADDHGQAEQRRRGCSASWSGPQLARLELVPRLDLRVRERGEALLERCAGLVIEPPSTFSSVKSFTRVANERSNVASETETSPNGEPPFGWSKMPITCSSARRRSASSGQSASRRGASGPSRTGRRRTRRRCRAAPARRRSRPTTRCRTIFDRFASTPLTMTVLLPILPSRVRISETAVTPGAWPRPGGLARQRRAVADERVVGRRTARRPTLENELRRPVRARRRR